jgi:hypothetical protein
MLNDKNKASNWISKLFYQIASIIVAGLSTSFFRVIAGNIIITSLLAHWILND